MKPDVCVLPHAYSKSPLTHYAISLAPKHLEFWNSLSVAWTWARLAHQQASGILSSLSQHWDYSAYNHTWLLQIESYGLSSLPSLTIFFFLRQDSPLYSCGWPQSQRPASLCLSHAGIEGIHHCARLIFHYNLWNYLCLFISSQDILMYPWLSWNSWHKLGWLCSQQRCAGPCFLSGGTKGTYHHAWLVKSSWVWTL